MPNVKTASLAIRKKLLLLVIFIFVSASAVITVLGLVDAGESIQRSKKDAILYVEGLAARQEQVTTWTKHLLSAVARSEAVQKLQAPACNALFREIMNEHPFYSFVGAATPDGNVFASYPVSQPGLNVTDRQYQRQALKTKDFSAGEFIIDRVSHVPSLHFSHPVLDSEGNLIAVLVAGFNLDEYSAPMATIKLPEGSEITILDRSGVRLSGFPPDFSIAPGAGVERDLRSIISGGADEGVIEKSGEGGLTRIYVYRKLRLKEDSTPYLYIMAGIPKAPLVRKEGLQILVHLLIVGIIGAIAMSVAYVYGNRMIAKPIKQLLTAAQNIGEGRMGTRTNLPHTSDGIGELARSFDCMASLLEKREIERKNVEEALGRAYSEMERKVEERTADLTRSNDQLSQEILERRRLEEVLRESERKFKTLFQLSPESILLATLEDGLTHEVNEAFCQQLGCSREEIIGKNPADVGLWTYRDEYETMMNTLASRGRVRDLESHLTTRSGETKTALMSVETIEMNGRAYRLAVARDITERKRAEEERARLVTAIEQVTEGIMIADANCVVQYVNQAYERITGYDRSELIGGHAGHFTAELYDPVSYDKAVESLSRGDPWSGHISTKRKDGTAYEVEVLVSPVRDNHGNITNYISIRRDVTLETKLEKELRQAQKMESIGTLAGGIAHDFNNILAAISGFTELALNRVQEDKVVQRHLEQVLQASSRAAELVRQILAFSRQTEQERKPVQVALIFEEVLRLLRSSLPATIEIRQEIKTGPDGGMILADLTQLHQVLMNLCTNAAHAMREGGGTLTVELSETAEAPAVSGYPRRDAAYYVCVRVTDTGHGMGPEIVERIFDPYFTTKGPGEGTGLGLSVVQGIVKSHGGVMTVSSEPDHGATFSIYFPGIEKVVPDETNAPKTAGVGGERILFVDDEESLADLGKVMLETLGYHVTAKTNSIEALETFREQPDAFDVVFTDMTMPGLTGKDLAARIMDIRQDIPVILCTGFSDMVNNEEARKVGIREVVIKPYIMSTIAVTIRKALDRD